MLVLGVADHEPIGREPKPPLTPSSLQSSETPAHLSRGYLPPRVTSSRSEPQLSFSLRIAETLQGSVCLSWGPLPKPHSACRGIVTSTFTSRPLAQLFTSFPLAPIDSMRHRCLLFKASLAFPQFHKFWQTLLTSVMCPITCLHQPLHLALPSWLLIQHPCTSFLFHLPTSGGKDLPGSKSFLDFEVRFFSTQRVPSSFCNNIPLFYFLAERGSYLTLQPGRWLPSFALEAIGLMKAVSTSTGGHLLPRNNNTS